MFTISRNDALLLIAASSSVIKKIAYVCLGSRLGEWSNLFFAEKMDRIYIRRRKRVFLNLL